jgi:hypothetical protein
MVIKQKEKDIEMYKMVIKQKDENLKSGGSSLGDSMNEFMDQKKVLEEEIRSLKQ